MKIGVSLYSYASAYNDNFTRLDAIEHAKKTGYDGVEFLYGYTLPGLDIKEAAVVFRKKCEDLGLEIFSLDGGLNLLNNDTDEQIAAGKEVIDTAEIYGAKNVRLDTITWDNRELGMGGIERIMNTIPEKLQILADYAASKNITLSVENHGQIMQDSIVVEKLINKVNRPNYGALIDMGNFLCADENPIMGVGRMAKYAKHVHCKDFFVKNGSEVFLPSMGWFGTRAGNYLRGSMLGHGDVPVYQCLRILKNHGYEGAISLEFEGMENAITAVEEGYKVMRKALDLIG